jgi:hypothetical protein
MTFSGSRPAASQLAAISSVELQALRVGALDQAVVVGEEVEALHVGALARLHGRADGAHIVAQMGGARRCDAGEKSGSSHGKTNTSQ